MMKARTNKKEVKKRIVSIFDLHVRSNRYQLIKNRRLFNIKIAVKRHYLHVHNTHGFFSYYS